MSILLKPNMIYIILSGISTNYIYHNFNSTYISEHPIRYTSKWLLPIGLAAHGLTTNTLGSKTANGSKIPGHITNPIKFNNYSKLFICFSVFYGTVELFHTWDEQHIEYLKKLEERK